MGILPPLSEAMGDSSHDFQVSEWMSFPETLGPEDPLGSLPLFSPIRSLESFLDSNLSLDPNRAESNVPSVISLEIPEDMETQFAFLKTPFTSEHDPIFMDPRLDSIFSTVAQGSQLGFDLPDSHSSLTLINDHFPFGQDTLSDASQNSLLRQGSLPAKESRQNGILPGDHVMSIKIAQGFDMSLWFTGEDGLSKIVFDYLVDPQQECTLLIQHSRVVQKSYGNEKRSVSIWRIYKQIHDPATDRLPLWKRMAARFVSRCRRVYRPK